MYVLSFVSFRVFRGQYCLRLSSYLIFCLLLFIIENTLRLWRVVSPTRQVLFLAFLKVPGWAFISLCCYHCFYAALSRGFVAIVCLSWQDKASSWVPEGRHGCSRMRPSHLPPESRRDGMFRTTSGLRDSRGAWGDHQATPMPFLRSSLRLFSGVNSGTWRRFSVLATFFDADYPNERNTFNLIWTVTIQDICQENITVAPCLGRATSSYLPYFRLDNGPVKRFLDKTLKLRVNDEKCCVLYFGWDEP